MVCRTSRLMQNDHEDGVMYPLTYTKKAPRKRNINVRLEINRRRYNI